MNWKVDSLESLVGFLREKGTLYAPTGEQTIRYRKIDNDLKVNLSRNSDFSAREIWQPITHYYLKLEGDDYNNLSFLPYDEKGFIVLGIRPCDIKGLKVFEKIFSKSRNFQKLRENTILIGYLCDLPEENCFCESMGVLPTSKENMDLVLYKTDNNYIISAESIKGHELFKNVPFEQVEFPVLPDYRKPEMQKIDIDKVTEKMDTLSNEEWESIAFSCINCRICSYVCPCCHCFSITDETFKNTSARAAIWDSCQCKYFTKEASTYNPRHEKVARIKNRMFHKFHYFVKQNNEVMCSGCGRCISSCPSGLNLLNEISIFKTNK